MYSNHWRTYGDPEEEYPKPASKVIMEQARHWYIYPHHYLKQLPEDQYMLVQYDQLTADPEGTIQQIYRQFGIEMSPEYQKVLHAESERAKNYKSHHKYSLRKMGLSNQQIDKEVKLPAVQQQIPIE
jgi:hypothetical protein